MYVSRCALSAARSKGRVGRSADLPFANAARASVYRCPDSRARWRTCTLKLPCLVIANLIDVHPSPSDAALERLVLPRGIANALHHHRFGAVAEVRSAPEPRGTQLRNAAIACAASRSAKSGRHLVHPSSKVGVRPLLTMRRYSRHANTALACSRLLGAGPDPRR